VTDPTDPTDHAVHHHGISVADLDRSLAFYRDALGFELVDRYTLSDEGLSAAIGAEPGTTGEFAQLDGRGARIELVEYDAGVAVESGAVYDTGATHLGIEVADVDAAVEALPADVDTVGGPRTTGSGTRICFLRDPDGTLVELLEL
jgi:catechol 2,3-dioxygenase-like lactoylglutathione lyase family enzyme